MDSSNNNHSLGKTPWAAGMSLPPTAPRGTLQSPGDNPTIVFIEYVSPTGFMTLNRLDNGRVRL
jgi:hypothetical protein